MPAYGGLPVTGGLPWRTHSSGLGSRIMAQSGGQGPSPSAKVPTGAYLSPIPKGLDFPDTSLMEQYAAGGANLNTQFTTPDADSRTLYIGGYITLAMDPLNGADLGYDLLNPSGGNQEAVFIGRIAANADHRHLTLAGDSFITVAAAGTWTLRWWIRNYTGNGNVWFDINDSAHFFAIEMGLV